MNQISVTFKSFNPLYIKKSAVVANQIVVFLNQLHQNNLVEKREYFALPNKKKKWTLIKSPHIDKKSREQFEWNRHKSKLVIYLNSQYSQNYLAVENIIFLLKNCSFPGVQLVISTVGRGYLD